MSVRRAVVGLLLVVGCAVEDEPAEAWRPVDDTSVVLRAYCARLETCECTGQAGAAFLSASQCDEVAATAETDLLTALDEHTELYFDGACLAELAAALGDAMTCDEALFDDACPCQPVYGSLAEGEACEDLGGVSACGGGLRCVDGECKTTCGVFAKEGEACGAVRCGGGLACTDGVCISTQGPASGTQPLCAPGVCPPETDCRIRNSAASCEPRTANGEACTGHSQCASLFCPAGYCLPAPSEGAACELSRCDHGLSCQAGLCLPDPDAPCYPPCGDGSTCDNGECVEKARLEALCAERLPFPGFG